MNGEKVIQYVAAGCVIAFVTVIAALFVGMAILAGMAGVG